MNSHLNSDIALTGAHFFHPVEKMPLVEIAILSPTDGSATKNPATSKITDFVSRLGKIPVYVKDSPCFVVNRLLCCYLLAAARLAESGVPLDWIEEAALDFGMPIGPLALLDEVGIDVAMVVAQTLQTHYGGQIVLPPVLEKVKGLGIKGKKSQFGIYLWDESGKRLEFNPLMTQALGLKISGSRPPQEDCSKLSLAMILPMVDEAGHCLEEKIVRRAREVDIATVLGIGFPAFRGGILRYADSLGLPLVNRELVNIYLSIEPQRKVSTMLQKLAGEGGKFYAGLER
jgi:3-hydroxyacyl-CoA dehydrogenase/enoyl-CoA hydratase/3-hydroxybutyryl-CoA epimerase